MEDKCHDIPHHCSTCSRSLSLTSSDANTDVAPFIDLLETHVLHHMYSVGASNPICCHVYVRRQRFGPY